MLSELLQRAICLVTCKSSEQSVARCRIHPYANRNGSSRPFPISFPLLDTLFDTTLTPSFIAAIPIPEFVIVLPFGRSLLATRVRVRLPKCPCGKPARQYSSQRVRET